MKSTDCQPGVTLVAFQYNGSRHLKIKNPCFRMPTTSECGRTPLYHCLPVNTVFTLKLTDALLCLSLDVIVYHIISISFSLFIFIRNYVCDSKMLFKSISVRLVLNISRGLHPTGSPSKPGD